jgi:hypothetical protein
MSKITLAPNASGTGTLTVAAPNTNTDRTLTLPDVTTTLVGTDATQTLTNKSIAGSQLTGSVASSLLTGALPAIDGSALTGIATGGMTLLGTLTTTSGTTATISGLNLTSYKMIFMFFSFVSCSATARYLVISGNQISPTSTAASEGLGGIVMVSLDATRGSFVSTLGTISGSTGTSYIADTYNGVSTITPSTTSITFGWSSTGNFDSGQIIFYGVK